MKVKENLPIMVPVHEGPHKFVFQFNSLLWGYVTSFISVVLASATVYALWMEDNNWISIFIFGILSLLFLYSAIYSFKLQRSIEIDGSRQVVTYIKSSLFKNIKWQKNFENFEKIKTFRPISTVSSPGTRKAKNWVIQLISGEDDIFDIGYNQFGALNRQKAEELVTRIADTMKIKKEIIDD